MYCPRCGSKIPESDSFCFKCGVDVNEPNAVEARETEPNSSSETRVAVKDRNGRIVWLPASEVDAFSKGQDALQRGECPPDFEQKKAAIMARLLEKDDASEKPVSPSISKAQSFAQTYKYRCPNCNVLRSSKEGTCNACGLTYAQAETLVRLKKENEDLQAKRQESKKANRAGTMFLAVLLNLAGCLAAFAAFFLIYIVLYWIITFIGRIPLFGAIIYWPSDASWVRLVTCISSAVFGGAWLSTVIAKNAKMFCGAIISIHIFTGVRLLIASAFTFTNLIECAVAIICAIMCFMMSRNEE